MASIAQAVMESVSKVTKRCDLKNVTVNCSGDTGLTSDNGVTILDTNNWYILLKDFARTSTMFHKGSKLPTGSTVGRFC
jgi:hypothetical protein